MDNETQQNIEADQIVSRDVLEVYRTQGGAAAFKALNAFVDRPMKDWGKKDIQSLEQWAIAFANHRVWPLAVPIWIALLLILKAGGEEEKCAYFYNDVGTAFFLTLDPRCFKCFFRALRLTKSPGRRMRTLERYAIAVAVIVRDYEKARRYFRAAIFVGERYRLDPKRVYDLQQSLLELERWLPGNKRLDELSFRPTFYEALRRDLEAKKEPVLARMLKDFDVDGL